MSIVFLYKENSDDRDCCAYIEDSPMRFECNHYFGGVNLEGACYSGCSFASYDDIKTILTREEYDKLKKFNSDIHDLGCGIEKGDERYNKGVFAVQGIQPVFDKLLSEENKVLFEEVKEEEKEYLMDEYSLNEEDIDLIFNNYNLEYRDRGIVGYVFDDAYECGYEKAFCIGLIEPNNKIQERYFDFEKFAEDLIDEDKRYLKLNDGRIVFMEY